MRKNETWIAPSSGSSYPPSHYRGGSSPFRLIARVFLALVIVLLVLSIVQVLRPVPPPKIQSVLAGEAVQGADPALPWPAGSGGEVEMLNTGVMSSANANAEFPLGSVAKMVTALVVIKDHPLNLGNIGPTITVTQSDVSEYRTMSSQGDAVIPVAPGEKLSEYQLLQALLIPSANNAAVILANWDAGSVAAFVNKMNSLVKSLGASNLVLEGPSGLNSHTVGSAHDLVIVAQQFLKSPVLQAIVAEPQVSLPLVGVTYNIDYNVGHDGFTGIETGSMGNEGNFVFAAAGPSGSKDVIVGALLGQKGAKPLIAVLAAAKQLVDAARKVPTEVEVLKTNQTVARVSVPGGNSVDVRPAQSVSIEGWPGLAVKYTSKFVKIKSGIKSGAKVGTITVSAGDQTHSVPLIATGNIGSPPLMWQLTRR